VLARLVVVQLVDDLAEPNEARHPLVVAVARRPQRHAERMAMISSTRSTIVARAYPSRLRLHLRTVLQGAIRSKVNDGPEKV
jgi:hypothetical protein